MQDQPCQSRRAGTVQTKFQHALAVLSEATAYAQRTSGDPWEFAVEIHQLRNLGLSENDLRYLVRRNTSIMPGK